MQKVNNKDNFSQDSWDSLHNEPKSNNDHSNDINSDAFLYNFSDDETREASAFDYMDGDRENYNRNDNRFRWTEPEEE